MSHDYLDYLTCHEEVSHPSLQSKPLIGIFINRFDSLALLDNISNKKIRLLVDANEDLNNKLVFFSLIDIDFDNKRIFGHYYNQEGQHWEKENFPYPEIIYQIGSGLKKEKNLFKRFQEEMKQFGARFINPLQSFDKWTTYKHLQKYPKIASYLPSTTVLNDQEDLKTMLGKYQSVYLKPIGGRKGKRILRIDQNYNRYKILTYHKNPNSIPVNNFCELIDHVFDFVRSKNSYIIQETIDLLSIDAKLIDLRAEVQRNGTGKLKITAIPVRLGKSNSPITQHVDSYKFTEFFTSIWKLPDKDLADLYSSLITLITNVYESIEALHGKCGEMGIDIAVDKNLQLYLIECNSKPTKASLLRAYGEQTLIDFYKELLQYASISINNGNQCLDDA
ncbi:YheC/YheD family protein [Natranaerobius thermophilus]|uniref:ATP-grasp domain-containing protein n=1 Tax=Natranaerobius thermophilus (strain ATCC BAA-1301 / DSM 18059 / JW/NM-WN-LF) TaxID=457570 RepID=B2A793_NATTJ|nr:YheC/YheD family protein [Natranaerobius thermophilus]ACB84287.1 conserved hypothetical protein [Natranaerobius thermophilus JW/NM-WN-LF]